MNLGFVRAYSQPSNLSPISSFFFLSPQLNLHSPSSSLCTGNGIFFGRPSEVPVFVERALGFTPPPHSNPADLMIEVREKCRNDDRSTRRIHRCIQVLLYIILTWYFATDSISNPPLPYNTRFTVQSPSNNRPFSPLSAGTHRRCSPRT